MIGQTGYTVPAPGPRATRFMCTAPGISFHDWTLHHQPGDPKQADETLRDCPDHDGTPPSSGAPYPEHA